VILVCRLFFMTLVFVPSISYARTEMAAGRAGAALIAAAIAAVSSGGGDTPTASR
jgi:hypothetical protein